MIFIVKFEQSDSVRSKQSDFGKTSSVFVLSSLPLQLQEASTTFVFIHLLADKPPRGSTAPYFNGKSWIRPLVELLKITLFTGGYNHGSCHVTGNCTVQCPILYMQPVAKNVYTEESGAALVDVL